MNKFITLALFALCATMANSQVLTGLPLNYYSDLVAQNAGGSSAASASSSAATSNNNGLISSRISPSLVSPLGPYGPVAGPLIGGPLSSGPVVAPWMGAPWLQTGWPLGTVGPVGPLGPLGPVGSVGPLVY